MMETMKLLFSLMAVACPLLHAGEWRSPHPLETERAAPVALIPFPVDVEWHDGICPASTVPNVVHDDSMANEAYRLEVDPGSITITAGSESGVFYAKQTLRQLGAKGGYPCCRIADAPAFPIRGFMHDTGRNFLTIDSLKAQLDVMARFKINTFHWHLTDHPAWRIESRKYPVLNDPSKRGHGRDENATYSFAQIRELFDYARKRHILIIPEIDMPGHSEYFRTAFGFTMHSPEGMDILEELLEEFCAEIPDDICPMLHIGADEIRIPNAAQFIDRMTSKVAALGRKPLQWAGSHDLPVGSRSISHAWGNSGQGIRPDSFDTPYIDSTMGYINIADPALLVRRYFFRQHAGVPKSDGKALGSIACLWPDVKVEDKSTIPVHNPQWPVVLAMAERSWKGLPVDGGVHAGSLPEPDTEAFEAFALFERRMEELCAALPFPYWRDTSVSWQLTPPVSGTDRDATRRRVLSGGGTVAFTSARGGNLYFRTRTTGEGIYAGDKPGVTVWAKTVMHVDKACSIHAMIGFDAPARSFRRWSGIPEAGQWSQCGTRIWLNGRELPNPRTCLLAGQHRYTEESWFTPANEIPFDDEEFWWTRPPVRLDLQAGENTLVIEQPYTGPEQSWGISFIPVKQDGARWIADESMTSRRNDNDRHGN